MSSYGSSTKRKTATSVAAATLAQYAPRASRQSQQRPSRPARTSAEREVIAARWAQRQARREHAAASHALENALRPMREHDTEDLHQVAERVRTAMRPQAIAEGNANVPGRAEQIAQLQAQLQAEANPRTYRAQDLAAEITRLENNSVNWHAPNTIAAMPLHPDYLAAQAEHAQLAPLQARRDQTWQAERTARQRVATAQAHLRVERGGIGHTYTFSGDPGLTRQAINRVVGRPVSDTQIGRLAAATVGDTLTVADPQPNAVHFKLTGTTRENSFTLRRENGALIMDHGAMRNRGARTAGSGAEVIRGFHEMQQFGINRLIATAARSEDGSDRLHRAHYNGYYTWAKLGFTGAIPPQLHAAAAARFGPHVKNVEDVMQQPGGPQWWKEHGDTWKATFDFTPGSYSMLRLARFRRVSSEK